MTICIVAALASGAKAEYKFGDWTLTTEKIFKERDDLSCLLTLAVDTDKLVLKAGLDGYGKPSTQVYLQHTPSFMHGVGVASDPWEKLGDISQLIFVIDSKTFKIPVRLYEVDGGTRYLVEAPSNLDISASTDKMFDDMKRDADRSYLLSKRVIDALAEGKKLQVESEYSSEIHLSFDLKDLKDAVPFFRRCAENNGKL